jgi:hypothetical protein
MRGHSRSKNGVASLAYVLAIHAFSEAVTGLNAMPPFGNYRNNRGCRARCRPASLAPSPLPKVKVSTSMATWNARRRPPGQVKADLCGIG